MTYQYKIRSVNATEGTFVVEFDGLQPLNFWIPHNESGFLTGAELENAIQQMHPSNSAQNQLFATFTNGSEIESLVEIATPTEEQIRQQRNMLLVRSDWTQLPDAPLTTEKKTEWETYRQALRDVTSQSGFPATVDWPVAP